MAARQVATTLLVSCQICNVQDSWCTDDRSTAVLFGPVMVMCVSAPDSAKDLTGIREVHAGVHEGDAGRTKWWSKTLLNVPGDSNIELGFLCMDEDDEMKDIFGPQCWGGVDADPGVFKVIEVVGDYEGVQVQGWIYLVDL